MKRIHWILLIVLVLVAAYFFFSDRSSTLDREYSDFAIEDTSVVDKIFIADYFGGTVTLERMQDNTWQVNGKYKVRKDGVDLLLKTFNRIAVREPVSKAAMETVIRELAVKSTKVEIYTGGEKPEKVYYVGHATKSHYGTNMLLEIEGKKSSVPFVTHVPGFFGYLSTRFFTDEDLWRDRGIFEYEINEIRSVELTYLEKPLKSFRLERLDDKSYVLSDPNSGEKTTEINATKVDAYLANYASIFYEFIDRETPEKSADSVRTSPPLHVIKLQDVNGRVTTLKTWYKPITDGTINPLTGEPYEYNLDRLYGLIDDELFVLMQWPTLDKLLTYKEDFLETQNVEN